MVNRMWVLGSVLAVAAIILLGWFLGVSPKLAEADTARLEMENVDAQNAAQEAAVAILADKFAHLDDLQAERDTLHESVPSTHELDGFFDKVMALAAQTGVRAAAITASEATVYGGAAAAGTAPATKDGGTSTLGPQPDPNLSGKFFTVPISINIDGSPDNVFAFIKAIQGDKRLFLLTNVKLTAALSSPAATVSGFVYVVGGLAGQAPAAANAGTTQTGTPAPTPAPTPKAAKG